MSEIIEKGYEKYSLAFEFKNEGIEFINNSNQEIRSVISEAHDKINNNWHTKADEKFNQELFRRYLHSDTDINIIRASIGYDFLKSNLNLL